MSDSQSAQPPVATPTPKAKRTTTAAGKSVVGGVEVAYVGKEIKAIFPQNPAGHTSALEYAIENGAKVKPFSFGEEVKF